MPVIIGPGNVRELENVILQAVVLAKSSFLDAGDLPRRIVQSEAPPAIRPPWPIKLGEPEKQILLNTLRQHGGNIKRHRRDPRHQPHNALRQLKKYQIDPDAIR